MAYQNREDADVCDCGSIDFIAVTCPETKKYLDQCKSCGNCGSHLCQDINCPSNEGFAQQLKDEEAIVEGEAHYRQSVLADEVAIGYMNPDCLDSNEDFGQDY